MKKHGSDMAGLFCFPALGHVGQVMTLEFVVGGFQSETIFSGIHQITTCFKLGLGIGFGCGCEWNWMTRIRKLTFNGQISWKRNI